MGGEWAGQAQAVCANLRDVAAESLVKESLPDSLLVDGVRAPINDTDVSRWFAVGRILGIGQLDLQDVLGPLDGVWVAAHLSLSRDRVVVEVQGFWDWQRLGVGGAEL